MSRTYNATDLLTGLTLFAYMLPAYYFLVRIETEFNAPFYFAFKNFFVPTIFAAYLFTFTIGHKWRNRQSHLAVIWKPAAVALFLVGFGAEYVDLANAVLQPQHPVVFDGVIVKIAATHIEIKEDNVITALPISLTDYQHLKLVIDIVVK